ncbi:hypothetical protein VO54_03670 [Elizabethkingia miricola]|nr:hypothetical protein VO54_03670 [Elizabethkingia miricola]
MKEFLIFLVVLGLLFLLIDLFSKFLVNIVVKKTLPNKLAKMNDQNLLKAHKYARIFSGTAGYIIGFFLTGIFVFSFMRIPKARLKCYEAEITNRDLIPQ